MNIGIEVTEGSPLRDFIIEIAKKNGRLSRASNIETLKTGDYPLVILADNGKLGMTYRDYGEKYKEVSVDEFINVLNTPLKQKYTVQYRTITYTTVTAEVEADSEINAIILAEEGKAKEVDSVFLSSKPMSHTARIVK